MPSPDATTDRTRERSGQYEGIDAAGVTAMANSVQVAPSSSE